MSTYTDPASLSSALPTRSGRLRGHEDTAQDRRGGQRRNMGCSQISLYNSSRFQVSIAASMALLHTAMNRSLNAVSAWPKLFVWAHRVPNLPC